MRKLLLLFAALLLLPAAAQAQADFEVFASASDIKGGSSLDTLRIDYLDRLPTGEFVFYNGTSGDLVGYDDTAGTTRIIRTAADLEDDLGTDPTVDDLDAAADGNIYILARDASNNNQVYKTDAAGATESVLGIVDGADAMEVNGTTVYLGIIGAFSDDKGNSIYTISTTGTSQSADSLIGDPDFNPADFLESSSSGDLYLFSSSFGSPPFENTLVKVDDPQGSPSLSALYPPYATGIFTNTGDGISDLAVANLEGEDHVYAYNASYDGPNAEEFGVFQGDGSGNGLLFATESDISSAIGHGVTGADQPLYIDPISGDLFYANRASFGGENEIIRIFDQPLPVEFDGAPQATVSGADVTLAWTTLSETGNAGFYVQHQRHGQSGWTTANASLIEGAGTATSAHTYRYTVSGMEPGRYSFRVKQVDIDDGESFSPTVEVNVSAGSFALQAPDRNPVTGRRATLTYSAPETAQVQAALFNSLGQQVRRLNAENGRIAVEAGGLASGLYFVRLTTADGQVEVQSVTLVR